MNEFTDLTNQQFGKLTVVKKTKNGIEGKAVWLCHCECGKSKEIMGGALIAGFVESCGCANKEAQNKFIDLTGKKIGRLTVVERAKKTGTAYWHCVCECGNMTIVNGYNIRAGRTQSCGCTLKDVGKMKIKDLTGMKFGRWTVIERNTNDSRYWLCECKCGTKKDVFVTSLVKGHSKSCGCSRINKERDVYKKRRVITNKEHDDLTNKRFGRLIALEAIDKYPNNKKARFWRCVCDCGNETEVVKHSLTAGITMSCGCLSRELRIKRDIFRVYHQEGTNLHNIQSHVMLKSNTSGVKGVTKVGEKFVACIDFKKTRYYLGRYNTLEEAAAARKEAEDRLFGTFLEWYYTKFPKSKPPQD